MNKRFFVPARAELFCIACSAIFVAIASAEALASEVTVKVEGVTTSKGEIGCALHGEKGKFPMDDNPAQQVWLSAESPTTTCRFKNVMPGKYAVAVSQDLNGNRKLDTNFFGMPTEPWGVSNNVRPALRAPKFTEAAITVVEKGDLQISIQVSQ